MLTGVVCLTALGGTLGALLGFSSRLLAVKGNPLEEKLESLLPGAQCGQCGYAGCRQAAAALADGSAKVTLCPPGGRDVAQALADALGVEFDPADAQDQVPRAAYVKEGLCIGCTRCIQTCSSDGIIGAPKQMHTVLSEACHGCGQCAKTCPTGAIELRPIPVTLASWHWHKPETWKHRRQRSVS